MKLTANQTAALTTVAQNPGQVVAFNRTVKDMIRINGNTENGLARLGLIETVAVGERTYQGHAFTLRAWKLTAAGKAALGLTEADAFEQMREAARAEGRRLGLTEAQIERFLTRQA